jgi:hypothetical protein
LREKKERQDETQFTNLGGKKEKTGWNSVYQPRLMVFWVSEFSASTPWMLMYFFAGFFCF